MAVWILTIGNSDIALKTDRTWSVHYRSSSAYQKYGRHGIKPSNILGETSLYTAPARIVGEIYKDQKKFEDLKFLLIDSYFQKIKGLDLQKIFVILSDQSNIFEENERRKDKCAYWKDTVTLESLIKKKLEEKFENCEIKFIPLEPKDHGLDDWDKTLDLVRQEIRKYKEDIQKHTDIYVSHQAGTPAMSSALQFVCLSLFGSKVTFLVSNEETEKAEIVEGSKYLRGLQIEKAKQLIKQGEPGAALELIKKFIPEEIKDVLTEIVGLFNIQFVIANKEINENISDERKELNFKHATKRIYDALGVVDILFSNQKYIVGATILAAAHETFLKAAIDKQLPDYELKEFVIETFTNDDNPNKSKEHTVVPSEKVWDVRGLKVGKKDKKGEIKHSLKSNHELLKILEELPNKFEKWDMLTWIGTYLRGGDDDPRSDLRNQFMHNLRGATKEDVILYISGQSGKDSDDLIDIYESEVVKPFHQALENIGLWDAADLNDRPSIQDRLDELIKDLDKLA